MSVAEVIGCLATQLAWPSQAIVLLVSKHVQGLWQWQQQKQADCNSVSHTWLANTL
jgi:hypothetical protein